MSFDTTTIAVPVNSPHKFIITLSKAGTSIRFPFTNASTFNDTNSLHMVVHLYEGSGTNVSFPSAPESLPSSSQILLTMLQRGVCKTELIHMQKVPSFRHCIKI